MESSPKTFSNVDFRTSFKWIVQGFPNIGSRIHSPQKMKSKKFSVIDEAKLEWCLVLTSLVTSSCDYCYSQNSGRRSISLYLENCKADEGPVSLTVYFSILDDKNDRVFIRKFQISGLITVNKEYGIGNFISIEIINQLLVKQNLKILCEIEKVVDDNRDNLPLIKGFASFINNETFSDVVLFVGDKKIRAHKLILISQSQVFQKMFSNDMTEAISNEVKVPDDISFEVFYELLRFMYTGTVAKLDKLGLEIFKAAHYYQIDNLQLICEFTLQKTLNVGNAIDILILCDKCNADCLKEHAISFILKNFKAIMKTNVFKVLYKTHPHLPFELLMEMGLRYQE